MIGMNAIRFFVAGIPKGQPRATAIPTNRASTFVAPTGSYECLRVTELS
jgi:hypothetical protein